MTGTVTGPMPCGNGSRSCLGMPPVRLFPILQPIDLSPTSLWAKRRDRLSQLQQVVHARFERGGNADQTDLPACGPARRRGILIFQTRKSRRSCRSRFFAGSEATATSLSSVAHHLLQAPTDLPRLTSEIRTAFGKESEMAVENCGPLTIPQRRHRRKFETRVTVSQGFFTRIVPGTGCLGLWLRASNWVQYVS